ncbi:hypothetical protein [Nocardia aurantia]|uniref:Uncharacterized protein n=1 Tax=Nocardia aurantia TaxID=2585199 RepID=A0A7K0DFP1_9NOCA|nr:hypothetical protein [Nocardia aurantia]MQY24596.1 hypothetical protein [Nocardia aurantia]
MIVSRSSERILFRTAKGPLSAMWEIPTGGVPQIMHMNDPESVFPAIRWPNNSIPGLPDGHIAFGPQPHQRPSIDQVREWLPQYSALWDEIREESLITHTMQVNFRPSGCSIGRTFVSADGLSDWTERVQR